MIDRENRKRGSNRIQSAICQGCHGEKQRHRITATTHEKENGLRCAQLRARESISNPCGELVTRRAPQRLLGIGSKQRCEESVHEALTSLLVSIRPGCAAISELLLPVVSFNGDRLRFRLMAATAAAYRVVQDRSSPSNDLVPATRRRIAIGRAVRSSQRGRRCLGRPDRSDPRPQVVSNASGRLLRADHHRSRSRPQGSSPPPSNSSARDAPQHHRATPCRSHKPANRRTACAQCSNRGRSRPV